MEEAEAALLSLFFLLACRTLTNTRTIFQVRVPDESNTFI